MIEIRAFEETDRDDCRTLLASLPDWFGLEASNRAYIAALGSFPTAVAVDDDEIVGFAALEEHNPRSIELHVIAVAPDRHRQGIGKRLLDWAEEVCRERGAPWFHVKTRGPLTPDPEYEKTRRFYEAMGFTPLFETLELWGPEDSALIMVKRLTV